MLTILIHFDSLLNEKKSLSVFVQYLSYSSHIKAVFFTIPLDKEDNIYFMCGQINKTEVNSLLKDVDVYVSLHRSEGFGLVMAEAMYLGTPVIATAWSGNTEFMNDDTACMVGYDMIELDKDYDVFKKGNVWADAHIDEAADYMVRLYEDKEYYNTKAVNGQAYAREHLAYKRSADIVSERLRQIHSKS